MSALKSFSPGYGYFPLDLNAVFLFLPLFAFGHHVEHQHSHRKRKDSLETRVVLLIFFTWTWNIWGDQFCLELLSKKWLWSCFSNFLLLWPSCQGFWGSSEDRYKSKKVLQMFLLCYNLLNSQNIATYQSVT